MSGESYDPKVYDLAVHFLKPYVVADVRSAAEWIAKRIQRGIEDDLEDLERDGHIKAREKVPF